MTTWSTMGRRAGTGLALLLACSALAAPKPAAPPPATPAAAATPGPTAAQWRVDPARSSIRFTATQAGAAFEGRFGRFDARIVFDAKRPGAGNAVVEIPVLTVDTRSADRDTALKGKDWFDPARWPKAVFRTTRIAAAGAGYAADGTLTIRDRTQPVRFTFTVRDAADGTHTLEGRAQLSRLAFGLGQGEFQSTEWVADAVTVNVTVVAR